MNPIRALANRIFRPAPAQPTPAPSGSAQGPAAASGESFLGDPLYLLTPDRIERDFRMNLTRGQYAIPTWAFHEAARVHPMLGDKVRFWRAALTSLDWNIRTAEDRAEDPAAKAQADALRAAYEKIADLKACVAHLALARFYGFGLLSIRGDNLEPLPWWGLRRDMATGAWTWNPNGRSIAGADGGETIQPGAVVIRTVENDLLLEALRIFLRVRDIEKWWDLNLEQESKRQVVVLTTSPPPGKEEEYKANVKNISNGGSGYLAKGPPECQTEIVFPPASRGLSYYENRFRNLDEQLTKALTGSLLTMLTQSGSGTLAGDAHARTLRMLIQGEAAEISAAFQRHFDRPILERAGLVVPGARTLAWFELAERSETDASAEIRDTVNLAAAGYRRDSSELSAATGWTFTEAPAQSPQMPGREPMLPNRARGLGVLENENPNHDEIVRFSEGPGSVSDNEMEEIQGLDGKTQRVKKLRETKVPVPDKTFEILGIRPGKVFADYAALQSKHSEQFNSTREVQAHTEFVMDKPDGHFDGNMPDHKMLVREVDGTHPAVALEIVLRGGKYRVRSVHLLSDKQWKTRIGKSGGPGESSGGAYVNRRLKGDETSLRLWAVLADQLPSDVLMRYCDSTSPSAFVNRTPAESMRALSESVAVRQLARWDSPARLLFERLAKRIEEGAFDEKALDKLQAQIDALTPEDVSNPDALADFLERALAGAIVQGVRDSTK